MSDPTNGASVSWHGGGRTTSVCLALAALLVLAGCGGDDGDSAERSDDVLGPVEPLEDAEEQTDGATDDAAAGQEDQPSAGDEAAATTDASGGDTGNGDTDGGGGDGGTADGGTNGDDGDAGIGASQRPAASTLEFTAAGSVLESTSGPSQAHVLQSCPIQPHAEQNIIDCAFASGVGGEVLVTVEAFAGDEALVVWERSGTPGSGDWQPVASATYGESQPDVGIQGVTVSSSAWPDLPDVAIVQVDLGGSGGLRAAEVVGWPAGASGAQVLAVTDPRPAASLRPIAGQLLLTANHLADGDPTCCPSEREIVVFEHPSGSPVAADRTFVPRDQRLPVEVALDVYAAWRDGNLAGVADLLTSAGEQDLTALPAGPGEDTFDLQGRACSAAGDGYRCTFADTGGGSTTFELTVRRVGGTWQVDAAALS